jgi:hypothetical protein
VPPWELEFGTSKCYVDKRHVGKYNLTHYTCIYSLVTQSRMGLCNY